MEKALLTKYLNEGGWREAASENRPAIAGLDGLRALHELVHIIRAAGVHLEAVGFVPSAWMAQLPAEISHAWRTTAVTLGLPEDGGYFAVVDRRLAVPHSVICPILEVATEIARSSRELWRSKTASASEIRALEEATAAALLLSAEHYAWWCVRRELLHAGYLSASEELRFTELILTKHPKSPEVLEYRRYVRSQFYRGVSAAVWRGPETDAVFPAAQLYPRNYYAWSHLNWLWTEVLPLPDLLSLERMLSTLESHLLSHVRDASALQLRQQLLLLRLLAEECSPPDLTLDDLRTALRAPKEWTPLSQRCLPDGSSPLGPWVVVVLKEWIQLDALMAFYPGHEGLWVQRRFLWTLWHIVLGADSCGVELVFPNPSASTPPTQLAGSIPALQDIYPTESHFSRYILDEENKFARSCLSDPLNHTFASQYLSWLGRS